MAQANLRRHVKVEPAKAKSLGPIKQCLKAWTVYIEKYCKVVNAKAPPEGLDAPWWYNERASVSTFAAAVVSIKGLVLEEYAENKKPRGRKQKKKRKKTRKRARARLGYLGHRLSQWLSRR